MQTLPTDYGDAVATYSHQQLVDALISEHATYLLEVGYVEEGELSNSDYAKYVELLTHAELLSEISCDTIAEFDEFMYANS